MKRCAKIVATIGPASQDEGMIRKLLQAGMNVARLNFSHGSHADHAQVIQRLRAASQVSGKALCILQDLQGPKIRTGEMDGGQVEIQAGQELILTSQAVLGNSRIVSIDFPGLPASVKPGGRILLDDGSLELAVIEANPDQVRTRVVLGGTLKAHKGVNLPGADLRIPCLTEKDEIDLAFGLENGVDAIALSFVHTADDIHFLRAKIAGLNPARAATPIIAKLERPEALDNLEAIVAAADGVMVARGDLGVEMPPETVPIAQKRIIECANRQGKLVITATQMLDSMIHNPRPTRAEASDIANAIFDGSDAVMLSGETASGTYPLESVAMMDAIVRQAEAHRTQWGHCSGEIASLASSDDDTYYVTQAARALAHDRNVAAIAVFTKTGRTAALLAKTRPDVPILAFTPESQVYPRLQLYWGVTPYLVAQACSMEEMVGQVESAIRASTPIQPGQQFVLICGFPVDETIRPTNLALLHTIRQEQ